MTTFQTSDGLSLHYEDEGEGLPILCLAGLTRSTRDFDYVTPHLAGNRVIKLDYRGRGRSDWAEDWSTYSLQVECRDVLELMAHLGLAKVAVIGTSRGGLNAMGLAMGAPDALLGVALNDVGPVIDPSGIDFILTYLGRNPASKTYDEAAAALKHVMVGFENMPEGFWMDEARRQFKEGPDGLEITYDPHLRKATEAMAKEGGTPDLWPLFDALAAKPLALIWGLNSYLLKEETVRQMQARNPEMILGAVPDRGHVPLLNEPEALAALQAWIEAMK
jgi:pimeloyl-ACP methyl ester carboxylesterase